MRLKLRGPRTERRVRGNQRAPDPGRGAFLESWAAAGGPLTKWGTLSQSPESFPRFLECRPGTPSPAHPASPLSACPASPATRAQAVILKTTGLVHTALLLPHQDTPVSPRERGRTTLSPSHPPHRLGAARRRKKGQPGSVSGRHLPSPELPA